MSLKTNIILVFLGSNDLHFSAVFELEDFC